MCQTNVPTGDADLIIDSAQELQFRPYKGASLASGWGATGQRIFQFSRPLHFAVRRGVRFSVLCTARTFDFYLEIQQCKDASGALPSTQKNIWKSLTTADPIEAANRGGRVAQNTGPRRLHSTIQIDIDCSDPTALCACDDNGRCWQPGAIAPEYVSVFPFCEENGTQ